MKKILLLLTFLITPIVLWAQDFEFGQFKHEELDMTRYAKDTTAHAVVLHEFGKTWLSSGDNTPLIHEYHTKIKIFDSQAFDQGTIQIPIYKFDNNRLDEVSDIAAVTYYKDEKGLVQRAELDPKQIFTVHQNKYYDVIKFTFPNLHKGCTIEYKYRMEMPRIRTFKTWEFQADIPKIYSEYEAHLPGVYNYNVTLRGPLKLTKNTSELEKECFSPGGGVKCDCSKMNFIMADVPAFIPEEYMTAPKNFISAIYFELSDYFDPNTNGKVKVAKEWKDVDYDMKHDDGFGGQIKRSGLMKDRIQSTIAGKTDAMDKAKAIYDFVKKNYKWDDLYGWRTEDGIKKALDNHSGSVAEINLTLIAALNAAGINTEAVLLSTREHGVVNKLYPGETDFDYVVAKANIAGQSYLLDATEPLLPFGLLPMRCMNDQGRVMSMDKPSYWMDLVASQKKSRTYTLDLTLQDDGKIKGTMINYSTGYEAFDKRTAIKKFNSVDEYVEDFDNKLKKIKILKSEIHNLDSLDQPLMEKYEIEMDAYKDLNNSRIGFSPFFIDYIAENPFKLQDRTYPIDRGAMYDDRFMLTMHIPQQFTVESLPQDVGLTMPLQGGRFLLNYGKTEDGIQVSHITQFNRSVYSIEEYPYLKEMFNKIIQAGTAEIVFKKK